MIQEDPTLAKDVKVLAIAVADNKIRADGFKAKFKVPFPVLPDEERGLHIALKEPVVPSAMLASTNGTVLMIHHGLIKDFDGMAKKIREIHDKQCR